MKLSEFDFTIEHRPGRKIPHADALSRHIGSISPEKGLYPEAFLREQAKDEFCKNLKLSDRSRRSEFFFFLDDIGLIYRRRPEGRHQLVVPRTLVNEVIRENHTPIFISHPGVKRTCDLNALSFWWSGMRKTIEEFLKTCDACQRAKEGREFRAPLGEVEQPSAPFQVTSMDITGPYPLTPRRNRYLLTFIDQF
jgi:hypothetical protein